MQPVEMAKFIVENSRKLMVRKKSRFLKSIGIPMEEEFLRVTSKDL